MATESLVYSGIKTPNFPRLRPVNNITPFTYQDGSTFLEILNAMETYIKSRLVPDIDKNLSAFVAELNTFIASLEAGLEVDRQAMQDMYTAFTELVSDEVALINNKTGAIDVQQITLTGPQQIAINPLWPNNQPVEYVIRQDSAGGRVLTYASNISGTVQLDPAPGAVTRFMLVPDGTGKWLVVQSPDNLIEFDKRVDASVDPKLAVIRKEIADGDKASGAKTDTAIAAVRGEIGTVDNKVTAANARIDAANQVATENGYVFANFVGNGATGEHLNLFYSPDGKTLFGGENNPVYVPADGGGMRDPSIIYRNDRWYVTYTSKDGQNKDFAIASSATGHAGSWSLLTKVNVSSVSGLVKAWAPEFIIDGNDVYIFFSRINSANTGAMFYVKATNTALTAWSAPSPVTFVDAPASYIDGVPVKGTDGKWYMFYSIGQSIDRAVSDKITGPWKTDRTGNWAGWGSIIEGPTLLKDGNIFRAYFDRYENNQGLHWSEAASLDGPWSAPVKVVTAPYVLKKAETIRHGSVHKLTSPMERNKITAALSMPITNGNHTEFQNATGFLMNQGWTTVKEAVVDEFETTNPDRVTFNPSTNKFKLNEMCIYAISITAGIDNAPGSVVTNVTRSLVGMVQQENENNFHVSNSGGVEDKITVSLPNFKPRFAGEEVAFRILAFWTGGTTAKITFRVRFTKIANI